MTSAALPVLDKKAALQRIGGDEELYGEIFELFLEDTPVQMEKLRVALDAGDRVVVERQAHSLKSASANIGAEQLREICFRLERASKSAAVEELRSLFEESVQRFSTVRDQGNT